MRRLATRMATLQRATAQRHSDILPHVYRLMALNTNKDNKLYYSIREVAQMFDINESTLRFWEKEFPDLRPKTVSSTKVRQYTEADIQQIRVIHNLIKVRGFKIAAARKYLHEHRQSVDKSAEIIEVLTDVRDQLKELKMRLDGLV